MSSVEARGHLSDDELLTMARAIPGKAPGDVALHLATCSTCQQRLLAVDLPERTRRKPAQAPTRQQRLLRILLVLAAIAVAILSMYRLLLS